MGCLRREKKDLLTNNFIIKFNGLIEKFLKKMPLKLKIMLSQIYKISVIKNRYLDHKFQNRNLQ